MDDTVHFPLQVFGLEGDAPTPGYEARTELVPDVEDYVFDRKSLQILRAWWVSGTREPLFIYGPQGCGKTTLPEQFAARLNIPVLSIMGRERMEKSDLVGTPWLMADGSMQFRPGPAVRAYREGLWLVVNEFSACDPGFWVANNEILERRPVYVEYTGEVVKPHDRFRLIVTDNTKGLVGDETGMFQRRFRQDASVMDRFWSMRMDYMEAEAEIALLRRGMAGLPEEIAVRFATALRRIAEKVRAAYLQVSAEHDAIEATISTRTLLRIRDLVVMFRDGIKRGIDPFQMAFAIALTNKCDDTTRTVIEEIVRLEIGDPAQAFGPQPNGASRP